MTPEKAISQMLSISYNRQEINFEAMHASKEKAYREFTAAQNKITDNWANRKIPVIPLLKPRY